MDKQTILTLLQVALIPLTLAIVNWWTQRAAQRNAVAVAEVSNRAEQQEAATTLSEKAVSIAADMLAPMERQLKLVTAENIRLVEQQQQLKRELNAEQMRHNQAAAEQQRRIDEQAEKMEQLKAQINALERVEVQRRGEIEELKQKHQNEIGQLKQENGRLRKRIDGIKEQLDTKPLLKKDTQS
ncbi:MAG: hypothetical protein KDE47_11350 [Caldilineaceae bacterium]|nr:hypothetical protein [Caldilineaceae bacterium]